MKPLSVARQLELFSSKPLRFVLGGEQLVPNDFHVTEVKRVAVESLDCGGGRNAWQELVVQLWSPKADNARPAMTAAKFSSILARAGALELLDQEPLRFEYGAAGSPAVQYLFERMGSEGNTVDVHLVPPHVACKPHERTRTELSVVQSGACCAPSSTGACCG